MQKCAFEKRIRPALFIHSLSVIGFQIILMRILSINQWDHFANMIIGIAMLGFGVSGSLLAVFKERIMTHARLLMPLLMILSAICMLGSYRLTQNQALAFDTFLVFSSFKELSKLILFIGLYFLPFFSASLAIGIIYVENVQEIGKLYFANLLGSGIGGALGLLLLYLFFPQNALLATALLPVIASLFLFDHQYQKVLKAAYLLFFVFMIWGVIKPMSPLPSQYKGISKTMLLPDAKITTTTTGIAASVQIVESDYLRYAPGVSLNYFGELPVKPLVFVNGNAVGSIPNYHQPTTDVLDYSTYKLPYLIHSPKSVAIISGGTGMFTAQALRNGAENIHVFEPNIDLIRAMEQWHFNKNPLVYDAEGVSLHQVEARSFLPGSDRNFDLIVLPTIGSFDGTSGMTALQENYHMTIEALDLYWQKLTDDGSLAVTVYTDFPPRAPLKTIYALTTLLKLHDITDPRDHIVAIRSWTSISYLVSKKAFTEFDVQHIRNFCADNSFDPLLLPGITQAERAHHNYLEKEDLFTFTDLILENETSFLADYPFYVEPAVDDKPYFSRYIKIGKLKKIRHVYPGNEIPFLEPGYVVVWVTFIVIVILSVVFILLPVSRLKKNKGRLPVLLYFGALGLGFMLLEIILIQRFTLYFGQPVFVVSFVLSILMVVSGIGSYRSHKLTPGGKFHLLILLAISLLTFIYALFLTNLLQATVGAHILAKVLIATIIISLPAFLMGMPFPLGLKLLNTKHQDKIAWAWGINGFLSVVATPLALILAVESGSFAVLILASLSYLIALVASLF